MLCPNIQYNTRVWYQTPLILEHRLAGWMTRGLSTICAHEHSPLTECCHGPIAPVLGRHHPQ